jgi:Na+/proline symporter
MRELLPIAVALIYAMALFAFASWANGAGNDVVKQRLRPSAYALAIAVYCTSWTFYGAVGSAVSNGWSYLPIYLGPILVFGFAPGFLRRLVDAVKADGANSISDFIGGRFGSSRGVAALVTTLALMGSIPYIALQLRSLSTSFTLISGGLPQPITMAIAAVALSVFAMIYGTRRYDADGRNDAVLFAVGVESLLKLFALLVAGALAVLLIAGQDGNLAREGLTRFSANFAPDRINTDFFVITLLSMAAIICLPRQFYITVIEARSGDDIAAARWPFIIYMVLTLLVVLPISVAGLSLLPLGTLPDLYVLQLPLSQGYQAVALLVFLGGFSAATAMVLVETIALATMVSNDLIAPSLLRRRMILAVPCCSFVGARLRQSCWPHSGGRSASKMISNWPQLALLLLPRWRSLRQSSFWRFTARTAMRWLPKWG